MLFSMEQSEAPNSARTPEELAFLRAVELSDISTTRRLMAENPTLNVDVIDALGRTALRLAVRNENRELVELLLEHCSHQNIQQAVLQAISEDHTSIAELMLKHPSYMEICRKRKRLGDLDGFFKTEVESQFSTDMTPLNLAAQKNNYAIVQLLLQRGETIPKPHKFSCCCMECRNRMKFDQLRMANFRLNAYRGLSSEAYISLSSDDPFLTGFLLAKELRKLSDDEKHFKKQYKALARCVSDYVVKLLDKVWTQQELSFVLNKKGASREEKYENLARFKLALENKEKKFVAHPSVQQHLVRIWHEDLNAMETHGWHVRLPVLAALALVYPIIVLAHFVKPDSKWTRLAKQPMVKFLGHTVSILTFLSLLIRFTMEASELVSNKITLSTQFQSISVEYKQYWRTLGDSAVPYGSDFPLRPHEPTAVEYLILIWVAGMVAQEVQQILKNGVKTHFGDLYNVVDFCMLEAYIGALFLFHMTMFKSNLAISELQGKNVTMMLEDRAHTDRHLYWLNTDRRYWREWDPTNVAEGLFAMANIVSFSRIINILPANESLGPMQISLGRMVGDFLKFLVFTTIAVVGFMVSLRNLFWWYSDQAEKRGVDVRKWSPNATESAITSFYDLLVTFRTVFWWIYGRGPMKDALEVPDTYAKAAGVTEEVGMVLAGLYHITIIIVLVNLLIAMMARSFEKIADDVDAEWKYARSLLYMEYISEGCLPPVPFNLLQPLRDVIAMAAGKLRAHFRKPEEDTAPPPCGNSAITRRVVCVNYAFDGSPKAGGAMNGNASSAIALRNMTTSSKDLPTYHEIVQTIVQRYIFDIQREAENSSDTVEEARLNLLDTKWDLLEVMEKRDNIVCHLTACLKEAIAEAPLLELGRSEVIVTRRRRWIGSVLQQLEEEEEEAEEEEEVKGQVGYPKTKVIITGSRI